MNNNYNYDLHNVEKPSRSQATDNQETHVVTQRQQRIETKLLYAR